MHVGGRGAIFSSRYFWMFEEFLQEAIAKEYQSCILLLVKSETAFPPKHLAQSKDFTMAIEAQTTTKKRDPAQFEVLFTGDGSKFTTRIPSDVNAMAVKEAASDKSYTYKLADLPQSVMLGLAAAGMKSIMVTHIRNHKDEEGTNVLELAAEAFAKLAEGKLYSRDGSGTSAKTGPKFDTKFWAAVAKSFNKRRTGKDATNTQVDGFIAKLLAFTPKDRNKAIADYRKNPHFNAAFLAEKAAQADAKGGDSADELDIF